MTGIIRYIYSNCLSGHFARNYSAIFREMTIKQNAFSRRYTSSVATSTTTTTKSSSSIAKCCNLSSSRSLIRVSGRDAENLLQSLITNDMALLTNQKAIYTMLLNIQGRVLYDAIIYSVSGTEEGATPVYYLECDTALAVDVQKHLKKYKLRKKVDVADISSEYQTWAVYDVGGNITFPSAVSDTISVVDPRVPAFGRRLVVPKDTGVADVISIAELSEEPLDMYATHRYIHGISEGVKDLPPGNSLPLEANLDYLNGVNFHKGCYLGQELTARSYHTGVIRKRLMPIKFIGDEDDSVVVVAAGETVKTATGKNAGKFRNHVGIYGIALIRMAHSNVLLRVAAENGKMCELEASMPEWWPHKSSDNVDKLHCN